MKLILLFVAAASIVAAAKRIKRNGKDQSESRWGQLCGGLNRQKAQ
jgi:hypothetical protein